MEAEERKYRADRALVSLADHGPPPILHRSHACMLDRSWPASHPPPVTLPSSGRSSTAACCPPVTLPSHPWPIMDRHLSSTGHTLVSLTDHGLPPILHPSGSHPCGRSWTAACCPPVTLASLADHGPPPEPDLIHTAFTLLWPHVIRTALTLLRLHVIHTAVALLWPHVIHTALMLMWPQLIHTALARDIHTALTLLWPHVIHTALCVTVAALTLLRPHVIHTALRYCGRT